LSKRAPALDALADGGTTAHGDDTGASVRHVEATHPKDFTRLASAGIDALTRLVAYEVVSGAFRSSGGDSEAASGEGWIAALRASGGDWAADVLAARTPALVGLA